MTIQHNTRPPLLKELYMAAEQMWGLENGVLISAAKGSSNVYEARQAVYLAAKLSGQPPFRRSYSYIGHHLNRDHSTIIHGYSRARERWRACPEYAGRAMALVRLARSRRRNP